MSARSATARSMVVGALTAAVLVAAAPAQAATGLVGHWRFDEGSGTTAADSSGFGDTGTLGVAAQWVTGHRLGAISFDGADAKVDVPATSVLEPQTVTVDAWVKSSGSPGPFKYIIAKGATGCLAASFGLYTGPAGGLQFYVSDGAGTSYTRSPDAGTAVWDGAWHHVAGTFDGAAVHVFVDDVEVGTGTPRTTPTDYNVLDTRDLLIGSYGGCGGLGFTGSIDEPKVWNRALTAQEIKASGGYDFQGFFAPVDNLPAINSAKAGSAIPVKFSLTGFQGLGIFAAGSPASQAITCSSSAPVDAIEETVTAGSSALSYNATTDLYAYVWKTDKSWAGTCRQLSVRLDDGSTHVANFKFTR